MPDSRFDVFLIYNSADRQAVEKLARHLADRSVKVWLDRWNMVPGQPWQTQFEEALRSSRVVAVFIGAGHFGSWQQAEYKSSLSRLTEDSSFRVIPILLPGSDASNIPVFLRQFNFLDLRDYSPKTIETIVDRIRTTVPHQEADKPYSPRIFLCHAKQDAERVEELYFTLGKAGFDPWYDKKKLLVGDRWESAITRAIEQTDFFAICLSELSANKKGFIQKEIRTAVREYQRRPSGTIYLLPIRLEECTIPPIKLDDTTLLSDLHWIDVFDADEHAVEELAGAIWKQWHKSRGE